MIDFSTYEGHILWDQLMAVAQDARNLQVISFLKPSFSKDGNQWCYILGNLPEPDCIVGFGDTPYNAMNNFCTMFFTGKDVNNGN